MIIKKYEAPTMTEALAKVRDELGQDAVILSTRSLKKGGMFDLMGEPAVEVTAAVDDKKSKGAGAKKSRNASGSKHGYKKGDTGAITPKEADSMPVDSSKLYKPPAHGAAKKADVPPMPDIGQKVVSDRLFSEIKDMRRQLKELADTALGELGGLPPALSALYKRAGERGLDDTIAKRLVRQLLSDLTGVEMTNPKAVVDKAKELLLPGIHGVQAVNFQGATPRKVAFIGPTGAGKTTSLAKLATDFTLNGEKKVSMLTIDSNRVDGFSQLKAYARIIDVKLHIAYTADEIPEVLPECRKDDIVLIDTPGIGPLDREGMLETAQFLEEIDPHEIHLVLSATTALPELKRAYESFSEMKPNRILFSKLDETDRYGAMLSFVLMAKQPLSYVTLGRNVPGDFSEAEPELIVQETLEPKKES